MDVSDREFQPRTVAKVLEADYRRNCFDEVSLGLTAEEAQKEAQRCLECGCREYFKCRLLNVAQRYDINPERFAGEMPQKYAHDENAFIERNPAKCILCGLCVRSCRETERLSVWGLLGRGFKTEVATSFSLPLDVKLCPTGALTEKSVLKKQVPLKEQYSVKTVTVDGLECRVLVATYANKVLRVIPDNENARMVDRDKLNGLFIK